MAFLFDIMVLELAEKLPELGKDAAGDGKYLDSYANGQAKEPNPDAGDRGERDAQWGVKEYHYEDRQGDACRCSLWISVRANESERCETD